MGKQITIKEIADRAGVSRATVDRVLHERGKVSEENLAKIRKVLGETGYKYNIHTSAVSLRKAFTVAIVTPEAAKGEYWDSVHEGILKAGREYSDIDLEFLWLAYDQFSKTSLQEAYDKALGSNPDAAIIGPGFEDITLEFCRDCDSAHIPYAFVDSQIAGTSPIASFTADQPEGGYIAGKILGNITPTGSRICVFSASYEDNAKAYNASRRLQGLLCYFKDSPRLLPPANVDMHNHGEGLTQIKDYLLCHEDIAGIAVLNSRGHLVAEALKELGRSGTVRLVAFDCTDRNKECLSDGSISVLLSQQPETQGFNAVKSIIEYLLYRKVDMQAAFHLMPIDILLKENLPYYEA